MTTLFNQPLNVINVGIAMFSDDLKKQHVPVIQLDWTPPGQGNMQVVDALDQLAEKPLAEKIAAANKIALERIIQSHPVLVGMRQRHQELVVYRTLGASKRLLRATLWSEFALLGLVAGLVAAIGAETALAVLQSKVFDFP